MRVFIVKYEQLIPRRINHEKLRLEDKSGRFTAELVYKAKYLVTSVKDYMRRTIHVVGAKL
jgi:hypothetical protein